MKNEYLAAENRILRNQIRGRLVLSDGEKVALAEIAHRLGRMGLEDVAATAKPYERRRTRRKFQAVTVPVAAVSFRKQRSRDPDGHSRSDRRQQLTLSQASA